MCLWQKRLVEKRRQVEAELEAAKARAPEYEALGRDLRHYRRKNHLADLFLRAAGGERK